jgi:hypothetical protein
MTPIVCILDEDDARSFSCGGIAYKCSSRLHHHFKRNEAVALVKAGDLVWLGKHKNVATYRNARTWVKVYVRNEFGEVIWCGMQWVSGGGF